MYPGPWYIGYTIFKPWYGWKTKPHHATMILFVPFTPQNERMMGEKRGHALEWWWGFLTVAQC